MKSLSIDLPLVDKESLTKIAEAVDSRFDIAVLGGLQSEEQIKSSYRDRCFYFLKERSSLAVDLARLSFARIDENVSEASLRYGECLGPTAKVVRNSKVGFVIKVCSQIGMRRDLDDILKERVTYRQEVVLLDSRPPNGHSSKPIY